MVGSVSAKLCLQLRLYCSSSLHRAPTVALTVMGMLDPQLKIVDIFPMSLVRFGWQSEAQRLESFVRCQGKLQC